MQEVYSGQYLLFKVKIVKKYIINKYSSLLKQRSSCTIFYEKHYEQTTGASKLFRSRKGSELQGSRTKNQVIQKSN